MTHTVEKRADLVNFYLALDHNLDIIPVINKTAPRGLYTGSIGFIRFDQQLADLV